MQPAAVAHGPLGTSLGVTVEVVALFQDDEDAIEPLGVGVAVTDTFATGQGEVGLTTADGCGIK